jgi:hypothetical protein
MDDSAIAKRGEELILDFSPISIVGVVAVPTLTGRALSIAPGTIRDAFAEKRGSSSAARAQNPSQCDDDNLNAHRYTGVIHHMRRSRAAA